eukprot:TRINITY_DN7864_c0_g1_i1.p1 TRINITY_DN7864_c0_g1~~TRINITY_DN7864_c0_g1_i1.p1  ORF type:complete len:369 (-),score=46.05 TRINITY_DN7864_c0_g1_i1:59-1165(-)
MEENSVSFDYDNIEFSDFDVGPSLVALEGKSLRKAVHSRRKQLKLAASNPPFIQFRDKLSFTLGTCNLFLVAFVLGKWPEHFPMLYTIKFPILLLLRFYLYRQTKWHYFMLDFCYFANALFMIYLWGFPESCSLFQLAFSFTAGPLSWAVVLWNNSLVFHSLDKITSIFIHITPSLVVWCLRWWPHDQKYNICEAPDGTNSITFVNGTLWPLVPYVAWQALYLLKVEYFDKEKFTAKDSQYTTSFLWLSKHNTKSFIYKLINIMGPRFQLPMFALFQFLYTFLTMIPMKLLYANFWAHTLLLIVICTASTWNGASFYIHVFSKRYQQSMMECEKYYKDLAKTLDTEANSDTSASESDRSPAQPKAKTK